MDNQTKVRETDPPWLKVALAEQGVHEIPGREAEDRIVEYHQTCSLKATSDEVPWCLDGKVEILTEVGWKKFSQLSSVNKVAQVHPISRKMSFVSPIRIIQKRYRGMVYNVNNRVYDLTCDVDHPFYGYWNTSKNIELGKKPLSQLGCLLSIPAISPSTVPNNMTDDQISLVAAFMADGCNRKREAGKLRIAFQVSKQRKIDFLHELSPCYYYEAKRAYGPLSVLPLTTMEFEYPAYFDSVFLGYKNVRHDWLYSLSGDQLRVFLETYAFFDGYQKEGRESRIISTSRQDIADILMTAATLAGYCPRSGERPPPGLANGNMYSVRYAPTKKTSTIKPEHIQTDYADIDLFCVEVPTGLILIRDQNKNPMIIGNCSAFANWCMIKAGFMGTNSAAAASWSEWGEEIEYPERGCIVVMERPGGNHVAFYLDDDGERALLFGGNQSDKVCAKWFPFDNFTNYRMPTQEMEKRAAFMRKA